MVYLKEDDEIRTVSQIFSLNIEYEDINQAVEQCLKYINDIKKKAKITQLMNIAEGDTEKLKELNELVKNNNLAREKERR